MANVQDPQPQVVVDLAPDESFAGLLAGHVELVPWNAAAAFAEGILSVGHQPIDGELLDRLPAVRVISNFGVGVDHIDVDAARARDIAVGNTPGVLDGTVADMAFALLLAAGRRVAEGDRYARGPDFTRYDSSCLFGREVHGTTLGIVGLGRIGEQLARRARGFEMAVLYHNRRRRQQVEASIGARYVPLDELLRQSDYVVLLVPLTPETVGLIGREALAKMKATATLINVSRGPVVDTDALTEALSNGQIYAAALDVTDPEPLPRDHRLLRLENLTITPHLGSATVETRRQMAELAVENLVAGLRGQPLPHEV